MAISQAGSDKLCSRGTLRAAHPKARWSKAHWQVALASPHLPTAEGALAISSDGYTHCSLGLGDTRRSQPVPPDPGRQAIAWQNQKSCPDLVEIKVHLTTSPGKWKTFHKVANVFITHWHHWNLEMCRSLPAFCRIAYCMNLKEHPNLTPDRKAAVQKGHWKGDLKEVFFGSWSSWTRGMGTWGIWLHFSVLTPKVKMICTQNIFFIFAIP